MSRTPLALLLAAVVALATVAALVVTPAAATAGDEAGWYEVSYAGPIGSDERAALDDAGAEGVRYRDGDRYLAWLPQGGASAAAEHDAVTGVRPLEAEEKRDERVPDHGAVTRVEVLTHPAGVSDLAATLTDLGVLVTRYPATSDGALVGLAAEVPPEAVPVLARENHVLHVAAGSTGLEPEGEASAQVLAGALTDSGMDVTGPGYADFLDGVGVDGEGVTVSIVDTGVDDTHPDLDGRMVERIDYSMLPTGDPWDVGGHGTHVAGAAVGGAGELPALGAPTDSDGFHYGLGIAPAAGFLDQNVITTTRDSFPPDGGFEAVTSAAVDAGAVGWNASWTDGGGAAAGYNANAAMMDTLVRDADFDAAGDQGFSLVFSAGNSGASGLTSPKEAKNVISVASSPSPYASAPLGFVSSFSSRGPAHDGRVAPTLTAPGETVAAARSRPVAQSCNAVDTASFQPAPADGFGQHAFCSGTSMAAPQVTGSIALVHDWWRQRNDGADPSPAFVKALLINSAEELPLVGSIPNEATGWGRVNLVEAFDTDLERVFVDQEHVFTEAGESFSVDVDVVDDDRPLKVSLVWTDAPGEPGADKALVNDLDLVVTDEQGTTFLGNTLRQSRSVPGGEPDRVDVVENVYLDDADGTFTVTVSAHNLPGDGVPSHPAETSQDFALVITNATE